MSEIKVTDNAAQTRFEAHLDSRLAGFADYVLGDGTIDFNHTEVDPGFGGRGVGSALVKGALDAVRADGGLGVIATCPFVASWIDKHPDYADLLA